MSIAFGPGISCGRPNLLECGLPEFGPVAIQAVPGQTGDQLRILDSSSNIVGGFDLNGNLLGAAASPSGSVILAPSSANRNLIQPGSDAAKALALRPHSVTQSADLLTVESADGLTLRDRLLPDGSLYLGGSPDGSFGTQRLYLTGISTVDVPLIVQQSAGSLVDVFDVYGASPGDSVLFSVASEGQGVTVVLGGSATATDQPLWVKLSTGQAASTPALVVKEQAHFQSLFQIFPNSTISMRDLSSTNVGRIEGEIVPSWVDSTDATRKARVTHTVYDTAARTYLIGEASGTAPKIGFLGTAAAVQQPTASAAGIAGIRTDTLANAVADIQTILTALRAWGVTFGLTANTA